MDATAHVDKAVDSSSAKSALRIYKMDMTLRNASPKFNDAIYIIDSSYRNRSILNTSTYLSNL